MKKGRGTGVVLLKQFNMRMSDDMRNKLEQLAVDMTIKRNKLVSPSEVMRQLVDEAFGKRQK